MVRITIFVTFARYFDLVPNETFTDYNIIPDSHLPGPGRRFMCIKPFAGAPLQTKKARRMRLFPLVVPSTFKSEFILCR